MDTEVKSIQVTDASSLVDKTVFLRVSFGLIGQQRKVKQDIFKDGSEKTVETETGPEQKAADYDKQLLSATKKLLESPELAAIKKANSRIRAELHDLCLPAPIAGAIMIPHGMVDRVFGILEDYTTVEFPGLVKTFKNAFPERKATAKQQLGPLFCEADYPTEEQVTSCFTVEYHVVNFGAGQLKAISPAMYKAASQKAEAIYVEAAQQAQLALRAGVLEMVTGLKEALTPDAEGKPKRFHKSHVTNLQEFIKNFDIRNVTNDTELESLMGKLKTVISGVNAEQLKSSDVFRDAVIGELAGVTGQLSAMVEVKPERVFKVIE